MLDGGGDDVAALMPVSLPPRRRAQLSLSVPQEVNTTSRGWQPRAAATVFRSPSSCFLACWPREYWAEGLPNPSVITRRAASAASLHTGVVAALSKYAVMFESPEIKK